MDMRIWRNRQTRTFEGRVSKIVPVQVWLSAPFIAELCKGSTNDSDSFCSGSNPDSAATIEYLMKPFQSLMFVTVFIFNLSH